MYRVNTLQQNTLLTPDEVIFHVPTKQTLDPRTVLNSIIVTELRFIMQELGYDIYSDMINQKNVPVTSSNLADLQTHFTDVTLKIGDLVNASEFLSAPYLKLWKQGNLWKLCAEAVLLLAAPDEFIQFRTEGIVHPNPPASVMSSAGVVTPDLKSVRWMMDKKLSDRIDPLLESVKGFICATPSDYPKYTGCPCTDDNGPQNSNSRRTNWVTGIYDSDDKNCGCDW
jgi:hypothetical protein